MVTMGTYAQQVDEAVSYLRDRLTALPEIIIQLGTGLSGLVGEIEQGQTFAYRELPHFPSSTVESHAGNLMCGKLGGKQVAILQGRFHYYEGYSTKEVTFPLRVLSLLGAQTAIITNASGGLNTGYTPGMIMVMKDHINLLPENPLRGPNIDAWGPRFPDLSTPYAPELRAKVLHAAQTLGISDDVCEGTYVCIPGPSLETPAETRYLKGIGAEAVGMSSVPEVLVSLHAGMQVLGLSVVANVNDPDNFQPVVLEDIIQAAEEAGAKLRKLIVTFLAEL